MFLFFFFLLIFIVVFLGVCSARDFVWSIEITSFKPSEDDLRRAQEIRIRHMPSFRTVAYRYDTTKRFYDDTRWISRDGRVFPYRVKVREALAELTSSADMDRVVKQVWGSATDTDSVD